MPNPRPKPIAGIVPLHRKGVKDRLLMIGQEIPQGLTRTPTASFQGVRARETQPCRCLADVDLRRSKICLWLAGPKFFGRRVGADPKKPIARTPVILPLRPALHLSFMVEANVGNHHLYSKGCITWFAFGLLFHQRWLGCFDFDFQINAPA